MGTRNLTMVVSNNETKIAQYGQWDGYPGGQGRTVLAFLKSVDMTKFKSQLGKVRFLTEEDQKERDDYAKSIGCESGWLNMEQAKLWNLRYPFSSRDHGAEILEMIVNTEEEQIVLTDSSEFAGDGLFCEWAYVIDLDKETFEVYEGFRSEALTEEDRFYPMTRENKEYSPVKMVKSYPLSELPDEDEFIKECERNDEEENED